MASYYHSVLQVPIQSTAVSTGGGKKSFDSSHSPGFTFILSINIISFFEDNMNLSLYFEMEILKIL